MPLQESDFFTARNATWFEVTGQGICFNTKHQQPSNPVDADINSM